MPKPRLLIFSSGSPDGGGSGFENLVKASRQGQLNADIVAVVSNHASGGVKKRADALGVPFVHFSSPWSAERYQEVAKNTEADYFALSGWLKLVKGLNLSTSFNSRTVFNIHPGPLPEFGGKGMYGHRIHEAVMDAFRQGEVSHTAINMHFVTEEYDKGPVFFRLNIEIKKGDTPNTLARRVNKYEHKYQPLVTDLVVNGKISWDAISPSSLKLPDGYKVEHFE